jgi:hypothetical protein
MNLEEQEEEERADYEIGWLDRLDCAPYEATTAEELFETKGMTLERMWQRLEAIHSTRRGLGPGWAKGWKIAHQAQMKL